MEIINKGMPKANAPIEAVEDWLDLVPQAYSLADDARKENPQPITQAAEKTLRLLYLHQCRLARMFHTLDCAHDDNLTIMEFDQLYEQLHLCSKLIQSRALRDDVLIMQIREEKDSILLSIKTGGREVRDMERTMETQQDVGKCVAYIQDPSIEDDTAIEEKVLVGRWKIRKMYARLNHEEEAMLRDRLHGEGTGAVASPALEVCMYCLAWMNIFVFALYGSGMDEGTLDALVMVFPILHAIEIIYHIYSHGVVAYLAWYGDPDVTLANTGSAVLVLSSLVGVLNLMIAKSMGEEGNKSRFLVASSTLLVFVKDTTFSRLIHLAYLSVRQCVGVFSILLVFMSMFGMICTDLFGSTATDDNGKYFFADATSMWATMFRLFVGEGWHDIMFSASDSTTVAARFCFFVINFIMAVLISQLVVGIVIQLYQQLEKVPTVRLYHYLQPLYQNHGEKQVENVISQLRKLNWRLFDIHNMIEDLQAPTDVVRQVLGHSRLGKAGQLLCRKVGSHGGRGGGMERPSLARRSGSALASTSMSSSTGTADSLEEDQFELDAFSSDRFAVRASVAQRTHGMTDKLVAVGTDATDDN